MKSSHGLARRLGLCAFSATIAPLLLAQEPVPQDARTWLGDEEAIEQYIIDAEVVSLDDIGTGVTNPKVADLSPGGPVERISFKPLRPGRYGGFWESYKSEIAAYELDKLLELGMTPPTVEKRINGDLGAASMWVSPTQSFKDFGNAPSPPSTRVGWWNYQLICAKMFHNLIYNKDPNLGNWLVDPAWNIVLIDNSRAFTPDVEMAHRLTRVDKDLWDRMLALDETALEAALGDWLDDGEIRGILRRRDRMADSIQKMVDDRGPQDVFVRFAGARHPGDTRPAATTSADLAALGQRLVDAINQAPLVLPASEFMWIGLVIPLATYEGSDTEAASAALAEGHVFGLDTELYGLLGLTSDTYAPAHYDRVPGLTGKQAEIFGMLTEVDGVSVVRVTRAREAP